jgi:hypothetical protein
LEVLFTPIIGMILMIEAASTSQTSVSFNQAARRNNPEEMLYVRFEVLTAVTMGVKIIVIVRILHTRRHENLQFHLEGLDF